jgi:8-oxo-dGTP pyrophosphatase MutT (NUDIX family)
MNSSQLPALLEAVSARQKSLVPLIHQLPPEGSRPLTVAGRVAGWVTLRATQCLEGMVGVRVTDEAVHVAAAPRERMPLDRVMSEIATALYHHGCLRGWRDERLDVYGEGRRLCVLERAAMRPLGLLTKAVHLNAWAPDGRIWIARRAMTKAIDPGMWDTLVGGLATSGETLDVSLLRECQEEAGLSASDVHGRSTLRVVLRMHRRLPEGYQVEDMLVSDCVLASHVVPRNMDGEVSEIRLATLEELWALLEADAFTHEAEACLLDSLLARFRTPDS